MKIMNIVTLLKKLFLRPENGKRFLQDEKSLELCLIMNSKILALAEPLLRFRLDSKIKLFPQKKILSHPGKTILYFHCHYPRILRRLTTKSSLV